MKTIFIQAGLLLLGTAIADSIKEKYVRPASDLFPRQDGDICRGTCASCFGAGNVVCGARAGGVTMCFNPDAGEECCANGQYCDSLTQGENCCGTEGAGVTLLDEPEAATSVLVSGPSSALIPSPVTSSFPQSTETTEWTCLESDSNQQCCERGGDDLQYCSGGGLTQISCYDPSSQFCCSSGDTCEGGANCCAAFGAVVTTPVAAAASTPGAAATGNGTPRTTARVPGSATTTSGPTQQTGANGGNTVRGAEGVAALAVGVMGLALL